MTELSPDETKQVDALVTQFQRAWDQVELTQSTRSTGGQDASAAGVESRRPSVDADEDRDESSSGGAEGRLPGVQDPPAAEPPALLEYANRAAPGVRDVAIARLLWGDLKRQQQHGEVVTKDTYLDLFEDHSEKQLAKDVFDQASDLPMLSARQIFLLAGHLHRARVSVHCLLDPAGVGPFCGVAGQSYRLSDSSLRARQLAGAWRRVTGGQSCVVARRHPVVADQFSAGPHSGLRQQSAEPASTLAGEDGGCHPGHSGTSADAGGTRRGRARL